jgi:hypothetical protein
MIWTFDLLVRNASERLALDSVGDRIDLCLGHAALEREKDKVCAAANAEFAEKVRDVKFHGAFCNIEFIGDFFVGKIFEQRIKNFLFAAA